MRRLAQLARAVLSAPAVQITIAGLLVSGGTFLANHAVAAARDNLDTIRGELADLVSSPIGLVAELDDDQEPEPEYGAEPRSATVVDAELIGS